MPRLHALTVADIVSLSRLVLAAGFIVTGGAFARLAIVAIAGITDLLDGWLARRRGEASPFGAVIDPAADRAFIVVVIGTLIAEGVLNWAQTAVLLSRDIVTTVGVIAARTIPALRRLRLEARFSGKVVTALQFATLVVAIGAPGAIPWLLVPVGIASVISIADYSTAAWRVRAAVGVIATMALASGAGAQGFPGAPPGAPSRYRMEGRLDGFAGAVDVVHAGLGVAAELGTYFRLAGMFGAGVAGVADETVASGRAEIVGRFVLDPLRQARWGLYGSTGLVARHEDGPGTRAFVTIVVGVELPTSSRTVPAVELGMGGGVRVALVVRRGRPGRR